MQPLFKNPHVVLRLFQASTHCILFDKCLLIHTKILTLEMSFNRKYSIVNNYMINIKYYASKITSSSEAPG